MPELADILNKMGRKVHFDEVEIISKKDYNSRRTSMSPRESVASLSLPGLPDIPDIPEKSISKPITPGGYGNSHRECHKFRLIDHLLWVWSYRLWRFPYLFDSAYGYMACHVSLFVVILREEKV